MEKQENTTQTWSELVGGLWAEPDYDDVQDFEAFDRRRALRDGWETSVWDGR